MFNFKIIDGETPITSDRIYDVLLNYKGYGNPNGKYWFIGMEEHWKFDTLEYDITKLITIKDLEYYSKQVNDFDEWTLHQFESRASKSGTFESGIKKILEEVLNENKIQETLKKEVFVTNSRFMPITDESKIVNYFPHKDYTNDDKEYRHQLYQEWLKKSHITFCLSLNYKERFESIFNQGRNKFEFENFPGGYQKKKVIYFKKFNNSLIFNLYHPSYPLFKNYLDDVKENINDLLSR